MAPLVAGDELVLDITAEGQPGNTPFEVVAECRRGDGVVAASLKVGFVYQPAATHDAGGR
jgi:hypothetical protein